MDPKPTILIIEDNSVHYNALVDVLGRDTYIYFRATTLDEARNLMAQKQPDLVISDVILQDDLDAGFNFCRRIKANSATKHIPVVIVTRRSLTADTALQESIGADAYITKPYSIPRVRKNIADLLQKKTS
ncbi:response regulator [candidate division KSB1 bacterium]|nr:response regulator [candidate division KSB1 bacterium]